VPETCSSQQAIKFRRSRTVDRTAVKCTWGGGYLPPGNYVFLVTSRPCSGVHKAPYTIPVEFGGWGWWGELIIQGVFENQQTLPSVVKVETAYSFPFRSVSHTMVWYVYRQENYSSAERAEGVRLLGRK